MGGLASVRFAKMFGREPKFTDKRYVGIGADLRPLVLACESG
jgi:hypothetical protein